MTTPKPAGPPVTAPTTGGSHHDGAAHPTTAPGAALEVRHLDHPRGVIIVVAGVIGRNDAAVLSRLLHIELDAATPVIVVDLVGAQYRDPAVRDVLVVARDRAHATGIALHVVDPTAGDRPGRIEDAWRAALAGFERPPS